MLLLATKPMMSLHVRRASTRLSLRRSTTTRAGIFQPPGCIWPSPTIRNLPRSRPPSGDIVISPTGYGNGSMPNGHVGIIGDNGQIMSNNSATGLWDIHFTLASWKARYVDQGDSQWSTTAACSCSHYH